MDAASPQLLRNSEFFDLYTTFITLLSLCFGRLVIPDTSGFTGMGQHNVPFKSRITLRGLTKKNCQVV
jgi:hypothetical protein